MQIKEFGEVLMNIVRYLLAIVAAFATYAVVYSAINAAFYPNMLEEMGQFVRSPEDSMMALMHIGHTIETIAMVTIYFLFVRSNDLKAGMVYGGLVGLYFAGTQLMTLGTYSNINASMVFEFVPIHIIVGGVVGAVLSKVYLPKI